MEAAPQRQVNLSPSWVRQRTDGEHSSGQHGASSHFQVRRHHDPHKTAPQITLQGHIMSLGTILLIVLILLLIGAIPSWPHSQSWGYGPSGGLGLVVLILVVLMVMGRI